MTGEQIVFEDDNLIVFHRHLGSTLVVSFNERGYRSSNASWGSEVFFSLGLSSLGYVSKKPNWFPLDSIKRSIYLLDSILKRYDHRITYGHSQGGYASIKYAKNFSADAVLSFCPQYSIDPDDLDGVDSRFTKYFTSKCQHSRVTADDIPNDARVYIFYDPSSKLDRFNVSKITRLSHSLIPVRVYGTDHSTIRPFAGREAFSELARMCLIGDSSGIRMLSRIRKRSWKARAAFLARSLVEKHPNAAIKVLSGNHHLLSAETAPLLIHHLAEHAKYEYIALHAFKFLPYVQEKEARHIYRSLLAVDDVNGAVRFSSSYFSRSGVMFMTDEFLPKLLYPECKWVHFCEGWSSGEKYGIWSISKRARLIIDWNKVPDSIDILKIKISQVANCKKNAYVKVFADSKELSVSFDEFKGIEIKRTARIFEVEFYTDYLVCPSAEGMSKDNRYLGITLPVPKSWLT